MEEGERGAGVGRRERTMMAALAASVVVAA